jgi:hypothetical protein
MQSQLERIKANLSVLDAWRILELPGTPQIGDNRSPLRKDKRASFTIFRINGRTKWFDHGEGCGGDVIDLWARARGLSSAKEALGDILERIPSLRVSEPKGERFSKPEPNPSLPKASPGVRWPPDLRPPTADQCAALGKLRGLEPDTFWLAGRLGTLKVATIYGAPAWILTDALARCAEARRFDGAMYSVNGKAVKSFCLPGSKKDLPLGLKTIDPHWDALGNILLVEGLPDYYAALQLAIQSDIGFRPIAILGAHQSIGNGAQQYRAGKKILITCHNDPQGQAALPKWVKALYAARAKSIVSQPLPFLHDDLNDFLQNPGPDQPLDLLKGFNAGAPKS